MITPNEYEYLTDDFVIVKKGQNFKSFRIPEDGEQEQIFQDELIIIVLAESQNPKEIADLMQTKKTTNGLLLTKDIQMLLPSKIDLSNLNGRVLACDAGTLQICIQENILI